jgi:hypothetical protein
MRYGCGEFFVALFRSRCIASQCQTVEPGICFSPHLLAPRESSIINHPVLERCEYVGGIRIEDAVAITEIGCDVLGKHGMDRKCLFGNRMVRMNEMHNSNFN